MAGPLTEIHVDPLAKPMTCHTQSPIPLYLQQKIHDDLIRDKAMGMLEKVPNAEPIKWCRRKGIARKQSGSPHRTVNLSPLNKFCKRETHTFEAPSFPQGAKKLVKNCNRCMEWVSQRPTTCI